MEFYAACEGYLEKQTESARVIRFASFRISEAMAGSKAIGKIENFWPMDEKDKKETKTLSKEEIQGIFDRHKLKLKTNG